MTSTAGTTERLLLVLTAAAGLAAIDLHTKLALETPAWAYHERSLLWVGLSVLLLLAAGALALIRSRAVAAAAGITGGGILGNLLSARWNDNHVPNPLLLGDRADFIAFNVADVFILVGILLLIPATMRVAIRNRERLREPSDLERRIHRWLGL